MKIQNVIETIDLKTNQKEKNIVWEKYFATKKILKRINAKATESESHRFENLYGLLFREDFIYEALSTLRSNKSINTPGVDKKTLDGFGTKDLQRIKKKLKSGSWIPNPIRRVYVPKPGRKERRPLGILTIEDNIIQQMMKVILENIYEPEFTLRHMDSNFGFRPNKSPYQAMDKLRTQVKNMRWAIEGDVEKAYDTVNHKKMIDILEKKINDKRFIKLIKGFMKSEIWFKNKITHSLMGTPQGGIVSPVLFNIYMGEFDKYIINEVIRKRKERNVTENRGISPNSPSKAYKLFASRTEKLRTKINKLRIELKDGNDPESTKKAIRKSNKLLKKLSLIKVGMTGMEEKETNLKLIYVRFADDWIITINGTKEDAENLKAELNDFLKNKLELKLSQEKTRVTDLRYQTARFLGFSFSFYYANRKLIKVKNTPLSWKKRTGHALTFGIDWERINKRLVIKGFKKKENILKGMSKRPWTVLTQYEIIMRFNQVTRGLIHYYGTIIENYSIFARLLYVLTYSCLHTLAQKENSSIRKIIRKYGLPAKTIMKKRENIDKEPKEVTQIDYLEGKNIFEEIRLKVKKKKEENYLRFQTRSVIKSIGERLIK